MLVLHFLVTLFLLCIACGALSTIAPWRLLAREQPRNSTGLTDAVQWDNTTFWIEGQRIFLHSGEFHTFRLPVPDLWLDIFQKIAAAGLNGVSIYIHWGLTNPAPGVMDFNDWRALQPMFDAAKLAGLFVVLRPGPYINAETTAGGLALWSTSLTTSTLRTNATDIREAWTPYIHAIINATAPNQVSNGGPVMAVQIDNEYFNFPSGGAEYFEQLEQTYRENGIVVPLTYNDPGERSLFINGTGAADVYGLDDYPLHFNCGTPLVWSPIQTNYHTYHETVDPMNVFYMPEYQGGAHNPWGGPTVDDCFQMTNPQFQDVFYKNNWAANVKAISYYMFYGGTNHGGIGFEGVYTSYDYGAAVRENRTLSTKFDELKRQGLFVRSSPEFRKTDWVANSITTGGVPGVSAAGLHGNPAFITLLRNPDTGAQFIVARQNDSTSTSPMSFNLTLPTSMGAFTIPRKLSTGIELNGRQSKVILTDYTFGGVLSSQSRLVNKLLYSTAPVLYAGTIGAVDVVFLYGDLDQGHEFAFYSTENPAQVTTTAFSPANFKGGLEIVSAPTNQKLSAPLVLYADTQTATSFFAPSIPASTPSSNTAKKFPTFFQFGTNSSILVGGPYLVRNASISANGRDLTLHGDLNSSVPLTLVVPEPVRSVSWNDKSVSVRPLSGTRRITGVQLLRGKLTFGMTGGLDVKVPKLSGWKFKDSLPEVQNNFDDSNWTVANHTTTSIPGARFGDGRILYGCDYEFCENVILWRGHFNALGSETSVNLTINGGSAFAATVWLNDQFIGFTDPGPNADHSNDLYSFEGANVKVGEDNVLTILQDHTGNNETPDQRSARGVPGFQLNGGNFTTWRVQGKLGGYSAYPDKARGLLNEGGLFGEREGWHLPGFDTSSWTSRDLTAGLPGDKAGVGFFVTTFDLGLPRGTDPMISFVFDDGAKTLPDQEYRAFLFVNGWKYGKRVSNIGPQCRFPVPPGILELNGKNTVAVALWAVKNARISPTLELVLDGVLEGGVGPVAANNPPWSPRSVID